MAKNYFLLRVSFKDLLLLCFCTDLLLSTTVSFLGNVNEFSVISCILSFSRPSHDTHLLTVALLNEICLTEESLLDDNGCSDDNISTALSVCVELSFVVLKTTGGESDVDNLSLLELKLINESCLSMLGSDTD